MNNEEFNRARSKVTGVFIARVAAIVLAAGHAIKGDYMGSLVLLAVGVGMGALHPGKDELR